MRNGFETVMFRLLDNIVMDYIDITMDLLIFTYRNIVSDIREMYR